jgi:hypothetical protein
MVIRISQIPFLSWGHFKNRYGCNSQEMTSVSDRLLFIFPCAVQKVWNNAFTQLRKL